MTDLSTIVFLQTFRSVDSCLITLFNFISFSPQPFPHQEFGEAHMRSTLKDLQLVPTGSLVLKKVQTPQVTHTGQWVTTHVGQRVSYHSNMGHHMNAS